MVLFRRVKFKQFFGNKKRKQFKHEGYNLPKLYIIVSIDIVQGKRVFSEFYPFLGCRITVYHKQNMYVTCVVRTVFDYNRFRTYFSAK